MNSVTEKTDSFPDLLQSIIRPRRRSRGCSPIPKSPFGGYYRHGSLEIRSHTDYNTASAEIVDQVLR